MSTSIREARAYGWGVALLFAAVAVVQSIRTLLWGDEFFTYWIGQQHSFRGIWRALSHGADPNPPLMHVLDWASTAAFGSSALAIRLPSVATMGLGIVCIWFILKRYFPPVATAAGCFALMTTRGFDYSYDARSYAPLFGFTMAALLCWERSRDDDGSLRTGWLVGLAASLALSLSSNYYGVLAWAPVAVGEVVRSRRSGWRWQVWLTLALAASPLVVYARLIKANLAAYGPHAWNRPVPWMIFDSYLTLVEGLTWPVLGLGVWWWVRRRRAQRGNAPVSGPALQPLLAAVWTLIALPVIGFFMAASRQAMISPRCVIPVCGGFALAAAILLQRLVPPRVLRIVVAVLVVWVIARQAACYYLLAKQRTAFFALRDEVERAAAETTGPVVVADSSTTLPLSWYASPSLRARMVEPIDFERIHRVEPDDSGEQNLWAGRGVFPVRIGTPADVLPGPGNPIVLAERDGWLTRLLREQGYSLREEHEQSSFEELGGVSTPLIHPTTKLLLASPQRRP